MDAVSQSSAGDQAESRRVQILNAAIAVFGEKGFQRATIKEIAARAGIAPGTIYLYYKNKHDLLVAIADTLVTKAVDETLAHAVNLSAEEYVAAIVRDRLQFARQNAAVIRALLAEIWTDRDLQQIVFDQIVVPIFALGQHYLGIQVKAGKLRPCRSDIVMPAFAGGVAIVSLLRSAGSGRLLSTLSDDEIVQELTLLYLHGLQPCEGCEPSQGCNPEATP